MFHRYTYKVHPFHKDTDKETTKETHSEHRVKKSAHGTL